MGMGIVRRHKRGANGTQVFCVGFISVALMGCFPGSDFNLDADLAACVASMGWSDNEIDSNGDGDLDGIELMVLINRCEASGMDFVDDETTGVKVINMPFPDSDDSDGSDGPDDSDGSDVGDDSTDSDFDENEEEDFIESSDGTFRRAQYGTNSCPDGWAHIQDESRCGEANDVLELFSSFQGIVHPEAGIPQGCYADNMHRRVYMPPSTHGAVSHMAPICEVSGDESLPTEVVYSTGVFGVVAANKERFNKAFQSDDSTGILRRECDDCAESHQDMYFKRKTAPQDFDAYTYMLVTWSDQNNTLHDDFDIYSSLEDAVADRNPWTFCNYNDPNIGFPRDCGPTGYVAYQWNSFTHGATRDSVRYSVVFDSAIAQLEDETVDVDAEDENELEIDDQGQTNLVENGSFDDGMNGWAEYEHGPRMNGLHTHNFGANGKTAHLHGNCHRGTAGGMVQAIETVPGAFYQLNFDAYSGNWDGQDIDSVEVTAGDLAETIGVAAEHSVNEGNPERALAVSLTFMATDATTDLTFWAGPNNCIDIDNVVVVEAETEIGPEPTKFDWEIVKGNWEAGENGAMSILNRTSGAVAWLGERDWENYTFSSQIKMENRADAGLMFRVQEVSPHNDHGQHYYVGLYPARDRVVLGHMNGSWNVLAAAGFSLEPDQWYELSVTVVHDRITVSVDGNLLIDGDWDINPVGSVGLRSYNALATYRNFSLSVDGDEENTPSSADSGESGSEDTVDDAEVIDGSGDSENGDTSPTASVSTVDNRVGELLENGSFEFPMLNTHSWRPLQSIPGWSLAFGPAIEVQNQVAGSPFDGEQLLELNSHAPSGIYQDVETVPGVKYKLRFAFSARPGVAMAYNEMQVLFGDTEAAYLSAEGSGLSDTAWQYFTFTVTAESTVTRIAFNQTGLGGSLGSYVDAVSLMVDASTTSRCAANPDWKMLDAGFYYGALNGQCADRTVADCTQGAASPNTTSSSLSAVLENCNEQSQWLYPAIDDYRCGECVVVAVNQSGQEKIIERAGYVSFGCDGVANSGAVIDECGVCGGDSSCLDCHDVPHGGAVNDDCGVCGGDGTSCRTFTSCLDWLMFKPDAESGTYSITPEGAQEMTVECDMESDGGGWTLITQSDFEDTECPGDWERADVQSCWRGHNGASTASFSTQSVMWSEARFSMSIASYNTNDGFGWRDRSSWTIDQSYVDGVSMTVAGDETRDHLFTYAIGFPGRTSGNIACPENGGARPQEFVGDAYTCDANEHRHNPERLFEDEWFMAQAPGASNRDIEIRLMGDEGVNNENGLIYDLIIYVR